MPEFRATPLALAVLGPVDAGLPQDWRDRALCTQTDPEVFYPEQGGTPSVARRICGQCAVRRDCLAAALADSGCYGAGSWGIWGGMPPRERRRLLRRADGDVAAAVRLAFTDPTEKAAALCVTSSSPRQRFSPASGWPPRPRSGTCRAAGRPRRSVSSSACSAPCTCT